MPDDAKIKIGVDVVGLASTWAEAEKLSIQEAERVGAETKNALDKAQDGGGSGKAGALSGLFELAEQGHKAERAFLRAGRAIGLIDIALKGVNISAQAFSLISAAAAGEHEKQVAIAKQLEETIGGLPFVGKEFLEVGEQVNAMLHGRLTTEKELAEKTEAEAKAQDKITEALAKRNEKGKELNKQFEELAKSSRVDGDEEAKGAQKVIDLQQKLKVLLDNPLSHRGAKSGGGLTDDARDASAQINKAIDALKQQQFNRFDPNIGSEATGRRDQGRHDDRKADAEAFAQYQIQLEQKVSDAERALAAAHAPGKLQAEKELADARVAVDVAAAQKLYADQVAAQAELAAQIAKDEDAAAKVSRGAKDAEHQRSISRINAEMAAETTAAKTAADKIEKDKKDGAKRVADAQEAETKRAAETESTIAGIYREAKYRDEKRRGQDVRADAEKIMDDLAEKERKINDDKNLSETEKAKYRAALQTDAESEALDLQDKITREIQNQKGEAIGRTSLIDINAGTKRDYPRETLDVVKTTITNLLTQIRDKTAGAAFQ